VVRLLPPLHAAQRGTPREIAAASKMIVGTSARALPLLLLASIATLAHDTSKARSNSVPADPTTSVSARYANLRRHLIVESRQRGVRDQTRAVAPSVAVSPSSSQLSPSGAGGADDPSCPPPGRSNRREGVTKVGVEQKSRIPPSRHRIYRTSFYSFITPHNPRYRGHPTHGSHSVAAASDGDGEPGEQEPEAGSRGVRRPGREVAPSPGAVGRGG
jgi:hypothetical protein